MPKSSLMCVFGLIVGLAACGGESSPAAKDNAATGKDKEPDTATLACGAETCKLPSELKGEELCCKDRFAGGCGVKSGASCRSFPEVDARCPPPDIRPMVPGGAGATKVFGCCTSAGECGVDIGGMGCMSRATACMVIGPDQVDKVKPQKCTGEALPLPANCGMGGFPFPTFAGSGG